MFKLSCVHVEGGCLRTFILREFIICGKLQPNERSLLGLLIEVVNSNSSFIWFRSGRTVKYGGACSPTQWRLTFMGYYRKQVAILSAKSLHLSFYSAVRACKLKVVRAFNGSVPTMGMWCQCGWDLNIDLLWGIGSLVTVALRDWVNQQKSQSVWYRRVRLPGATKAI